MPIFMPMNTANTIEIPGLLTKKISKKLTFNADGITIEKPTSFMPTEFIPVADMIALRYGVNWLRGYQFVFGRQYFVEIQTDQQKIYRIKMGSYYGN